MNWDEAFEKAMIPATGLAMWFYFMWMDPGIKEEDDDET